MQLNKAMLFVSDLPRMTAFYADALGFRIIPETRLEDYVEFDTGGAEFALHLIPLAARCEPAPEGTPVQPRERGGIKLIFTTSDVAAEVQRLEKLGVTILRRPWGGCDGVDPEGNVFGFFEERSA